MEETTRLIEVRTERQARVIQKQFVAAVNATEALSGSVTSIFENEEEMESSFKSLLKNAVSRMEFDSAWMVLNEDVLGEKSWFSYTRDDETGELLEDVVNDIDGDWYFDALEIEGTMVDEEVEHDTINDQPVLITSTYSRVLDGEGKTRGIVGIDIKLKELSQELCGEDVFNKAVATLINSEGLILASDSDEYEIDEDYPLFNEEKEYFARDEKSGPVSFKNNKNLVTLVPVAYDRLGSVWTVAIETPMSSVLSSTVNMMVFILSGFLIYLLCLIGGVGFMISRDMKSRKKEREIGNKLTEEVQNLVVSSKENAATSQDQSAAVKEIVATMEDSNRLSKNISNRIEDVSSVATKTTSDVESSTDSLNLNIKKLDEISKANSETIEGIKKLGEEISNIWEIVTMITSVADQAKIIAFNAELEAASAGEAGKSFHIVATEIRRLADGIIENTKDIKQRISTIQHSSDVLILAGESGTAKVMEGVNAAKALEEKFNSIKSAAEITESSAKEICMIIQQQTAASSQILIALKQISAGVENFSMATENISSTSESLKEIALSLNQQQNQSSSKK